jgi:hypothetical protein
MKTALRLAAIGVCIAACSPAVATPIVVARVAGGFLVGSNYARSTGSPSCKLHYVGKRLLLLASEAAMVKYYFPGERPGAFDVDKDIWPALRGDVTDLQLLAAVHAAISRDIQKIGPSHHFRTSFALVLLSTEGKEPRLWTDDVEFPGTYPVKPVIKTTERKLRVGD